jgi:hypothetical protein
VLYCGRHDFGTRLLKKTGNLKLVVQTMVHLDTNTALKYHCVRSEFHSASMNATRSFFSWGVSFVPRIRLKNSTVSSKVINRSS